MKFSISMSAHFVLTICRFVRWAEWFSSFRLPWRYRMVVDHYAIWARCVLYPSFREGVRAAHAVSQVFGAVLDTLCDFIPKGDPDALPTQQEMREVRDRLKAELEREEEQWTPINN